ncbi:MAG: hypothetical protein GEU26_13805 [Nitrososphaeraceae archaeon]|nr:hypothetical protein [Nitrososphaeraceae archaeon]
MLDDKEFLESLTFDDLKKEYTQRKKELISDINNTYLKQRQKLIRKYSQETEIDKRHRMILNACIFPFSHDGSLSSLGYYFVRASPLSELGISNLDFLLFHPDSPTCSIFGEVKGSINDSQKIVDELKLRMKEVEKNDSYIKDKYIKNQNTRTEFVLGAEFPESNEIHKTVLRKGGKIKVWAAGHRLGSDRPVLSLFRPLANNEVAKSMLHEDPILTQKLKNIPTSFDYKSMFPESHIVAQLKILLLVEEDEERCFALSDLNDLVKEELIYLEEEQIKVICSKILSVAENIGFVQKVDAEQYRYKITSKGRRADTKEDDLKKKWIDFAIHKELENEKNEKVLELQKVYIEKKKKRKTITDYFVE